MKKTNTIIFNFDSEINSEGKRIIRNLIGLKINERLTLLSSFEKKIDTKNYKQSLQEALVAFEKWIENPYNNKFITFNVQDMKDFVEICKEVNYKAKVRDFHKIIGYQYWNIQNEMAYRIGHRNEMIGIKDLLSLYAIDYIGDEKSAKDICYNTYVLVQHFKSDNKRNNILFVKKQPHSKSKNALATEFNSMNLKPIRSNGEKLMKEKVESGWEIELSCKATLSGVVFYAVATHVLNGKTITKSSSGENLEAVMNKLFIA